MTRNSMYNQSKLPIGHPYKSFAPPQIIPVTPISAATVVSGWIVNLDPTNFTSTGSTWPSTTSGNTWTVYNAPSTVSTPGSSVAVIFNSGRNQYAMDQTGITSGPANSSTFTIDLWFLAAASVSGSIISEMGQSGSPASGWNVSMMYLSGNTVYAAFWQGSVYSLSLGAYSASTWTHACYTYSGTSVTGYVNGVQVSTGTSTKQYPGTGYYCLAGGGNPYFTTGGDLSCQIGAYKCYASALTAAQVKQNYNALCGRFGLSTI